MAADLDGQLEIGVLLDAGMVRLALRVRRFPTTARRIVSTLPISP